ncbi:efflux RND transporter periplasmic adaptor subunit [Polymorphum gilvum]|jgi:RND family efflux transporter MFP subunit|uniref:Efflux transporter, RND family, MFP subunit n=1 Tax=Polymorphum gilvum (strain LMG 25793 / CGMCC 1.9160 / SL003B-26A1) TaxID=991905 RepID=F2J157_POLGS|nr:efflux RND transporter periplasmic adaptor subunit [Polymorphum gilvum]ADZ68703.1 Efflux transporter, RND family, MFP subunit [Polymorphum gilvum SL003B-26A1]
MRNVSRAASLIGFALALIAAPSASAQSSDGSSPALPVTQVMLADVPVTYTVPGSVISDGRIEVSSRVVGFIEQLDVREGQKVSRGDLLVRIDQTDIDEAIQQAQAGVRAADEDLQDAEFDVQKFEGLARSGSVSTETLRKAKVRVDVARATLDGARSTLAAAEAQKDYATITSPVDGVVVSVARRSGEMATAGSTILTVESREVLLFKAFVSEGNLAAIDPNTPVTIRIDALDNAKFTGRIRGIVPSGDDVTRRYEINVILPKDQRLLPGMFGRAEIILGTQKSVLVPAKAIVRRGGLDGVFVVEERTARFRWLRTGQVLGDTVEVVSGLSGGETILAAANDAVRDGSAIRTEAGR